MKTPTSPLRQQFVFSQKAKHPTNPFQTPYHLKEFLVPAFERIAVFGNAKLMLVLKNPGDTIYAEGDSNSIEALNVFVKNGTLNISSRHLDFSNAPLEITIPVLNKEQMLVEYNYNQKGSIY